MATPDLSNYVALSLFDQDPQTIIDKAVDQLSTDLPGWQPREASTEMLTLEAYGLEIAELIYAINRLPGAIMQAELQMVGVNPDIGAPPMAAVTFNLSDTAGHVIPAGTRCQLVLSNNVVFIFSTSADLDIAAGSSSGTVNAVADRYAVSANGTAVGTRLSVIDSIGFVDTAALATAPTGGRDSETGPAWLNRGVKALARLTSALVLPQHFLAAALEDVLVSRAYVIDTYNPASGNPPGVDGGHVTVAVYGPDGFIDADDKLALQNLMDSQSVANLAVHVIDPTITQVNVVAVVVPDDGYTDVQATTNATAAVAAWLDTQSWDWDPVVRLNKLIGIMGNAAGVAYVQSISSPPTDLTLPAVANLTAPGTITITAATS